MLALAIMLSIGLLLIVGLARQPARDLTPDGMSRSLTISLDALDRLGKGWRPVNHLR